MLFPSRLCQLTTSVLLLLSLVACGGRAISKKTAQGLLAQSPLAAFDKEEVYIESVSQTGQRDAVVEARLKAAFKFEKVGGNWLIREVRLGNRPWEKIEDILRALQAVKTEETRKRLERVAYAIERYCARNGALPAFRDYISLSDVLHPNYMTPLIREDAWQQPLAAFMTGPNSIRLVSAGSDGTLGSGDDIVVTRSFPP